MVGGNEWKKRENGCLFDLAQDEIPAHSCLTFPALLATQSWIQWLELPLLGATTSLPAKKKTSESFLTLPLVPSSEKHVQKHKYSQIELWSVRSMTRQHIAVFAPGSLDRSVVVTHARASEPLKSMNACLRNNEPFRCAGTGGSSSSRCHTGRRASLLFAKIDDRDRLNKDWLSSAFFMDGNTLALCSST